jgi:hypothetical protein
MKRERETRRQWCRKDRFGAGNGDLFPASSGPWDWWTDGWMDGVGDGLFVDMGNVLCMQVQLRLLMMNSAGV